MTEQEFSSEFDLLYNNVSSNQAPGFTEYEKSVFLTKAQDEIIKNYFTNVQGGNKYQQGIEDSRKRYADFSTLLTIAELNAETTGITPFDERGKIFKLPDGTTPSDNPKPKVMIVVTETFKTAAAASATTGLESYQVIPLRFDEYIRLMSKPSSDPLKKQVWKLMGNNESGNGSIEIVPHWKDKNNATNKLVLKYIRKPYPIILEDLTAQGFTIEGYVNSGVKKPVSGPTPESNAACCELAEELHPEILQRAVELAKVFYQGEPTDVITAGQRSE